MKNRMDRSKFNIGTYFLHPFANTEKHVRDLTDCGINFVVCMHNKGRRILDLFEKYHVGCVVSGYTPGWWGGNGSNAGKLREQNPLEDYAAGAKKFADHPAVWGIDIGDEPSALDFPYYREVVHTVEKAFPNQFAYLNLYPNYASVAKNTDSEVLNQLGTPTYAEHIKQYCEQVDLDYICYDFYLYSVKHDGLKKMYDNFRIVADACRDTGKSFWYIAQVNSNKPEEWISENRIRFQAFHALAYGAESMIWANYTTDKTAGWWYNQVLDEQGKKTQQYDKLKKVNTELLNIAPEYMKYRRVDTHLVGFADHPELADLEKAPVPVLNTGAFIGLCAENGENLAVGQMTARNGDGSCALMISAADDPMDEHPAEFNVNFRADGWILKAYDGKGCDPIKKNRDGSYTIRLQSSAGVLVTAKRQ